VGRNGGRPLLSLCHISFEASSRTDWIRVELVPQDCHSQFSLERHEAQLSHCDCTLGHSHGRVRFIGIESKTEREAVGLSWREGKFSPDAISGNFRSFSLAEKRRGGEGEPAGK
jgi:hypothetical protein